MSTATIIVLPSPTVKLTSHLMWIDFCAAGQAGFAADCRICLESFFACHRQFASDQPRCMRIGHHADAYHSLVQSLLQSQGAADSSTDAAWKSMHVWRQTVWQDTEVNLKPNK